MVDTIMPPIRCPEPPFLEPVSVLGHMVQGIDVADGIKVAIAPCVMSRDMLQCLLVYSLWELE